MERGIIRREGADLRRRLFSAADVPPSPINEALTDELEFGRIWSRDGLDIRDRFIASLTCACLLQRRSRLRDLVSGALDTKMTPQAMREVFLQCSLYGGLAIADEAVMTAADVFEDRGASVEDEATTSLDSDDLKRDADAMRRDLHGDREADGHADPDRPFSSQLYDIASLYGYGIIWRRPGVTIRQRFICALAAFTCLGGMEGSFRKFALSAAENGLAPEAIREVVIQTVPYSGFPRALAALLVMDDAFSDAA